MRGSTAHEKNSIHMDERMGNSVGRRFVWDRYQADKQSSQGGVAAAAGVVVVVLVAERHTSSGPELRTQMMVSAAAGSVLCKEATERSSRRVGLAVAPVLDLEDPCYRSLAQPGEQGRDFSRPGVVRQEGRRCSQCRRIVEHITSQ